MVLRHLPELICQFWISPAVFVVVRMFLILKFSLSGLQLMYVNGCLGPSAAVIVDVIAFFFTLKTKIVPSRLAKLGDQNLRRCTCPEGRI